MTHAELSELLGAYALDAVSPEEAIEIEEHLAQCPRCRAELTAHREVAGVLGNFGGTAPAGLWDRIANELAIGSVGALTPAPATPETPPAPATVIPIGSARHLRSVASTSPGGPPRERRRSALFAAVALVAAALALTVGILGTQVSNLNQKVSALSQAVVAGGVKGQVLAAELDPNHRTVDLTSANASWSAQVVTLPSGQAWLIPGKMPAISSNETFQAWAFAGGKYISLGVLGRSPGDVALLLQPGMSKVLVNTEPNPGAAQPTTSPFVSGTLPTTT
ncbi:MAG TPA: anti-sigma factor [Acidimicrobiales bacterium]|nr:anti-sigma factor [Acidimicrobiales bacterium]